MRGSVFVLCVVSLSLVLAAPPSVAQDPSTIQADLEPVWEQKMLGIVSSAVSKDGASGLEDASELVQVSGVSAPSTTGGVAAPLPQLADHISSIQGVLDRIAMENVNAVAIQDALASSYEGKRAELESLLAIPQQAIIARKQERHMCIREVGSLQDLSSIVAKAVERDSGIKTMRQEQANHYRQTTEAEKALAEKNKATLSQVVRLLQEELVEESKSNNGFHFDPIALRQRKPEDMIRHASELVDSLASMMASKLKHQGDALEEIIDAFNCEKCDAFSADLKNAGGKVKEDVSKTKTKCDEMAELHRPLDEADRETVITLKKELGDLDEAERVHQAAEEALKVQRQQSEHVAKKMVGFFQQAGH